MTDAIAAFAVPGSMAVVDGYTIVNLEEIEDSAAARGLGFSARFPREAVNAERTGFALLSFPPGAQQPFGHHHEQAEEVYFVISGTGEIKFDDGVHPLRAHDIVRVASLTTRAFRAGPDGLEMIAFGPRHAGDGKVIEGYWDA
jgi:mannose-6-phosphate isomerase-like protein (cupin superfamily)